MSRFTKKIGKIITDTRKEQGLSQEELGHRAKLTKNTIGLIENGEINTGIENIYKICNVLNISITIPPK